MSSRDKKLPQSKLPYKTFNLYNSFNADIPFTERLYKWVTSIGRYIIIGVEMVVLFAFIARFILDQSLNNLKEQIDKNDAIIKNQKAQQDYYQRIFDKTTAAKNIQDEYTNVFIPEIPKVFNLAPAGVKVLSIDVTQTTMTITTQEQSASSNFETLLKQSILNPTNTLPNPNATVITNVSESNVANNVYKIVKAK